MDNEILASVDVVVMSLWDSETCTLLCLQLAYIPVSGDLSHVKKLGSRPSGCYYSSGSASYGFPFEVSIRIWLLQCPVAKIRHVLGAGLLLNLLIKYLWVYVGE